MYLHFHDIAFFQKFHTVDLFGRDRNLFERFGIHEVISHVISIQVLKRTAFDANFIHFNSRIKRFIENTPGCNVFEFGTDKSRALTGFYMKKFDDEVVLTL